MTATPLASWSVVLAGAETVAVPRGRRRRRALATHIQQLPPGTPVVLRATGWGARGRCRHLAEVAQLDVVREWLAVPSLRRPLYLAEATPVALAHLWATAMTPPPRLARGHRAADLGLRLVARVRPWRLFVHLAPQRLAWGVRR